MRRSIYALAFVLAACAQTPEDAAGAVVKAGKKGPKAASKLDAAPKAGPKAGPKLNPKASSRQRLGLGPKAGQKQLAGRVKGEVVKALGPDGESRLAAVQNSQDYKALLGEVKAKCEDCKVSAALLEGLKVVDTKVRPGLGGGTVIAEAASGDCGPFHCLSWWGEHFPCQGMPGDEDDDDGGEEGKEPGGEEEKEPETEPADPSGGEGGRDEDGVIGG